MTDITPAHIRKEKQKHADRSYRACVCVSLSLLTSVLYIHFVPYPSKLPLTDYGCSTFLYTARVCVCVCERERRTAENQSVCLSVCKGITCCTITSSRSSSGKLTCRTDLAIHLVIYCPPLTLDRMVSFSFVFTGLLVTSHQETATDTFFITIFHYRSFIPPLRDIQFSYASFVRTKETHIAIMSIIE